MHEEDYIVSGKQIDLEEYLCNRIVEVPEIERKGNRLFLENNVFLYIYS